MEHWWNVTDTETPHYSAKIRGGLKSYRSNYEKNKFLFSKLFLFFDIISIKTNTFIPVMLQRHYPVLVVVHRKICKIPPLQLQSFGVKLSFTKNFLTARYSVLSILRDTDNTPASDSCIKQTT
jgi:hypothetical protein